MSAAYTVILPHKRNDGNDAALRICLDCLNRNSTHDYILLMDAAYDAPLYERINRMVQHAPTECCVYLASDTFFAPDWDTPMLALYDDHSFVTNVLVECGAICVHPESIHKDFGRKPETFDRAGFEAYVLEAPVPSGEGWYCPYMFPRSGYLAHGGLEIGLTGDHHGFTSADVALFERWKAAGNRVIRAKSYAYHLQRWSEKSEQVHEKRELHSP